MYKTWVSVFGFGFLMFTAVAWTAPDNAFYCQADTDIIAPSYTKLDVSGNALSDSAASWSMVKDNVTGLIWEVKTNKNGVKNYSDPHDADNTYSWYDRNPGSSGGYAGTPEKGKDTEAFINALNAAQFGGYSDWRLPTLQELNSIVNYDISSPGPTINATYFPNTQSSFYWTSTPSPGYDYRAWVVGFDDGYGHNYGKYGQYYVRAVRGRLEIQPPRQRYWDNSSAPNEKDRLAVLLSAGNL
ncbi:MAG: DUF1566 domain-containing protein [Desulfatirhabdiaceae bacterium]|nr:DUF1566 domain-containing protein [Desulfatirhabdiaceae bacterium]